MVECLGISRPTRSVVDHLQTVQAIKVELYHPSGYCSPLEVAVEDCQISVDWVPT